MRKPNKSTLKRKLDKLAGEAIRSIGYCEAHAYDKPNSCSTQLQWCHLKSRRYLVTRWDPLNAVCMCAACHRFFTDHPDHFRNFIEDKFPGRWDYLNAKFREPKQDWYSIWLDYYKNNEQEQEITRRKTYVA